MEKLTKDSPETRSLDVVVENIAQLKALFPEATTEGRIDFEMLKQLLGSEVEEREERYGLNWHGKRQARQLALTPSTGTLRPSPGESLNWDGAQNLVIEGDNLEVLKLLQKSYCRTIKFIYIDPPYNTGNDFVYSDDFKDNIDNYLKITGQLEGGKKVNSNTEASGRFHTDWLNMMYPRLKLAHSLLRDDGAIFISCDDGEVCNLRHLLDSIFGEECFVAQFIWRARKFTDARANTNVSTDHEYILAYARNTEFSVRGVERDETKFANPDGDPRGPWMSRSILGLATKAQRPNLHYCITDPASGKVFHPDPSTGWRYSQERMTNLIADSRILFPKKDDGRPREKKFRCDMRAEFIAFRSIIDGVHTADGTQEIRDCFGDDVFSFPKPTELIRKIIGQVLADGDICLDFFAGSGTTGHAVMAENATDGGRRKFILVQLPERLDPDNREQAVAARFLDSLGRPRVISELTKERLRRSAKMLMKENPSTNSDLGFRVFKLDSSNIRPWEAQVDNLMDAVEHIKEGRTEQDLLFELLLKLGLDLTVPMEQKTIAGKTVHSIGAGVLMVCLDEAIAKADYEALGNGIVAWHRELAPTGETTLVFRDSAFADDVVKTNLTAILSQGGLDNVRSL